MRFRYLTLGLLVACGGGSDDGGTTNPPTPAPVSTVAVSSSTGTTSLVTGATLQLAVVLRDAQSNALTGRTIAWTSSADAIATVTSAGNVTAVAPGTATIRATSEGKTGELAVTVTSPPWTVTGSLATGRTLHTATLLANGKVLVVGGQTVGPPFATFASAELYDPATGTWTATGGMVTGRENHVAIRLNNGKVLIAGGYSIEQTARLRSAELYDPATGTWSSAGNLVAARDNPAAALLADGQVLVTGGSGTGTNLDALNSAELYDPTANTWTSVGNMTVARAAHSAALLSNGKVLIAGGSSGSFTAPQLFASAELYDPATRTFAATGSFTTARGYHKAITIANSRVLIVGGSNLTSTVFGTTDVYDPASGAWTAAPATSAARLSHTATLLANGRVVVVAGSSASTPITSVEVFDPASNTWTASAPLRTARSNHATVLLTNGKLLVVGGQGTGAATSAELFDPSVAAGTSLSTTSAASRN